MWRGIFKRENIVGGFRKVIQDLLVPELKAVQVELKHQSEQFEKIDNRFESMQLQIDTRFEAMDKRFEAMQKDIQEIKIDLRDVIKIVDTNTKFARMEGQMRNIEHMFLEHIGMERKLQAV